MTHEEAIGILKNTAWLGSESDLAKVENAIEKLSEIPTCSEKPNNWIPVSERLPDEDVPVIVTRKFLGLNRTKGNWNEYIKPSTYVEIASRIEDEWFADSDEYKVARSKHTDPIAWMPLPEPYNKKVEE